MLLGKKKSKSKQVCRPSKTTWPKWPDKTGLRSFFSQKQDQSTAGGANQKIENRWTVVKKKRPEIKNRPPLREKGHL
jgi:hypothetical protein